eukprot:1025615-Pyramimonas_sp.AAC.1
MSPSAPPHPARAQPPPAPLRTQKIQIVTGTWRTILSTWEPTSGSKRGASVSLKTPCEPITEQTLPPADLWRTSCGQTADRRIGGWAVGV